MRISGNYPWGSETSPPFDLRVLSLGAGVQSSCLLYMMRDGEFGDEYPRHAVFSDTGSEPESVYTYLEHLKSVAQDAGVEIHVVSAGNLGEDILAGNRGERARFAAAPFFTKSESGEIGMGRRQCTREYKIAPIATKMRELLGVARVTKGTCVESWQGISYDEMGRMKEPRFPWQWSRYPLIERRMTRADCLAYISERGYPEPPKSACVFCPFRDDRAWAKMRDEAPQDWAEAIAFDDALREGGFNKGMRSHQYVHRSGTPLREAELNVDDPDQLDMFQMECEGMCGV